MASRKSTYVSATRAEGRSEGRTEEAAKSILLFLKSRNITIDDHSRRRVEACTDLDQLERWIVRAAVIDTIGELFAD